MGRSLFREIPPFGFPFFARNGTPETSTLGVEGLFNQAFAQAEAAYWRVCAVRIVTNQNIHAC